MKFRDEVKVWGTSSVIVIPKTILETLQLKKGNMVDVDIIPTTTIENIVTTHPIRTFFCNNCSYEFPTQDDDEDVVCPICQEQGEFIVQVGE